MTLDWNSIIGGDDEGGGGSGDLIPADTYDFRVKEATAKKAASGSDMIELVMAISGGPYDDQWIWLNLVLPKSDSKPGHRRFFNRNMRALGFESEWLTANQPTLQQIADMMVGRSVRGVVVHKEWEGAPKAEISKMMSMDAATGVPSMPSVEAPPVPDVPVVPTAPPVPEIPVAPQVTSPPPVEAPAVQPVPEPTAPPVVPPAPQAVPEPTTPPDSAPF